MVIDETGRPLQGTMVRLDYRNYPVENASHELERYTDDSGRVVFPAQRRFALIISRCYFQSDVGLCIRPRQFRADRLCGRIWKGSREFCGH